MSISSKKAQKKNNKEAVQTFWTASSGIPIEIVFFRYRVHYFKELLFLKSRAENFLLLINII